MAYYEWEDKRPCWINGTIRLRIGSPDVETREAFYYDNIGKRWISEHEERIPLLDDSVRRELLRLSTKDN